MRNVVGCQISDLSFDLTFEIMSIPNNITSIENNIVLILRSLRLYTHCSPLPSKSRPQYP